MAKAFYLTSTERNPQSFDIYRYSTEDYSRELVYENPGFQVSDISGDGRWVALDKPRTSADFRHLRGRPVKRKSGACSYH